ncbi:MAG TPA: SulP family inorganic anion transporter [Chryseolinea sp.]
MRNVSNPLGNLSHDIPASIVVFLVALPLCLGIALASGAPMFAGIIAGIVGGLVIGSLSGSQVSVSGPAAGLTTIVIAAIHDLGSFQIFLCAVVLAGAIQIALGFLKAGSIGHFFPSAVIKGMLAAIGIILILKQVPHALGYDRDFEGDESFVQPDGQNTFTEILNAWEYVTPGAILICLVSLAIIMLWERPQLKKYAFFQRIPSPLVVVLVGISSNLIFEHSVPFFDIPAEHLVSIQASTGVSDFLGQLAFPDFSALSNSKVYFTAITLALVASLESLLSLEAADKMDPFKRTTPPNRELKAQGIGNMISGLIGGLPITAVIVRSSANISSGARTRASTILHGMLLLLAVILIPRLLNLIPLASLAAILIMTGFKLTKPALYVDMFRKGVGQYLPFIVTVLAILFTNLLVGIFIGIIVGVFFVLRSNFQEALSLVKHGENYLLRMHKDVSFLNKALLRQTFEKIPRNTNLIIDGGDSQFIDADIIETIEDFMLNAPSRHIQVEIKKSYASLNDFFRKHD